MSDRLPWFRCFPSRLLGALAGMEPDEGYIYVALLLRIYETGGPVAETSRTLSRRTGLSERRATSALEAVIASGKIQRTADGRLDSETTHEEIAWQADRRGDQSKAGKASAERRSKKHGPGSELDGGQKRQQNQTNGATPVERTSNQEEREIDPHPNGFGIGSETSSEPCPKRKRVRTQAEPLFNQFWQQFPTDSLMSKKAAAEAFRRLSDADKRLAIDSLPAFRTYCSAHPDYRTVHACRYLSQRRFEGFLAAAKRASQQVFVPETSPAFAAWQQRRRTPVTDSREHGGRGWYFPSEWPPQLVATG